MPGKRCSMAVPALLLPLLLLTGACHTAPPPDNTYERTPPPRPTPARPQPAPRPEVKPEAQPAPRPAQGRHLAPDRGDRDRRPAMQPQHNARPHQAERPQRQENTRRDSTRRPDQQRRTPDQHVSDQKPERSNP